MLKSLDRYILKEVAVPFGIGLSVYTFTLLINNIMLLSHTLVAKAASAETIARILLYLLPDLLAFTIPMSTLMGILAGFSRLSSDSETVALKTMGISNRRLLKPVMMFCLSTWLVSSVLIMFVAPEANFRLNSLLTRISVSRAVSKIKPRTFYREFPFTTLYFANISDKTGEWEKVFLYSQRDGNTDSIILARSGRFMPAQEDGRSFLLLKDARVHSFKKNKPEESYSLTRYAMLKEDVSSRFSMKFSRKSHQLIFPELLKRHKKKPGDILLSMEFHNKFALPFTCLIFGVLALSLGLTTRKGGKISGFIISLAIIFIYYTLSTSARSMILKGALPPGLGMWAANIFLILTGAIFFYFTSGEKSFRLPRFQPRNRSVKPSPLTSSSTVMVVRIKKLRFHLLKRIDQYVIRRILFTFLFSYLSLMLVFFIIGIMELIDDIVDNRVPFIHAIQYVIYNSPNISSFTIPVSLLTAVLLSYSLMSKNNEIVAVQISGTSLHRLAVPALLLGILTSLFSFFLQERIAPGANRKALQTLNIIHQREDPVQREYQKNWVEGKDNVFYFYGFFKPATQTFSQFNIVKMDSDFHLMERISARKANWTDTTHLNLSQGFIRRYRKDTPSEFSTIQTHDLELEEGKDLFKRRVAYTQHMNIRELRQYIQYLKENRSQTERFESELYQKYAFPFSSLIMVLIAIPFSFMMGSKGTVYGIGIAVGISMVFWGTVGIFNSLGASALLPPHLSAFAPLFLFSALSFGLFLQVRS